MKLKSNLISFILFVTSCALPCLGYTANADKGLQLLKETSKAFAQLAKQAAPAVVYIETARTSMESKKQQIADDPLDFFNDELFRRFFGMNTRDRESKSDGSPTLGSGFLVSADGYILTSSHVVKNASEVKVTLHENREYTAKVIGVDTKTDVALVKIDAKDLPYLDLADSTGLEVGEWVMAIGTPFGLETTVTVGVVSAKGRNQLRLTDFEDFIQTDAAINPGNSGGPLINMDGQVVGINTAMVSPGGLGYIGIGFAVPSNMAKPVMDQLIKNGKVQRGYLGVVLQQVEPDLAQSFGMEKPEGALLAEVRKGSPAEKAGLKAGDIILKYNGISTTNINQFRTTVAFMAPGTQLNLSVFRGGKIIQVTVTLGLFTETDDAESSALMPLGIIVEPLTSEFASKYGYTEDAGVIISKVQSGSVAEKAGLKPGALILTIDQKKIESVEDYNTAVESALRAKRILLHVKQGNVTRFLSLKF